MALLIFAVLVAAVGAVAVFNELERRQRGDQPVVDDPAGDPSALLLRLGPNDTRWDAVLHVDHHWVYELDAPDLGEPFHIWLLGIGKDPADGFAVLEYLPYTDGDETPPNAPHLDVRIDDVRSLSLY